MTTTTSLQQKMLAMKQWLKMRRQQSMMTLWRMTERKRWCCWSCCCRCWIDSCCRIPFGRRYFGRSLKGRRVEDCE